MYVHQNRQRVDCESASDANLYSANGKVNEQNNYSDIELLSLLGQYGRLTKCVEKVMGRYTDLTASL